MFAQTSITYLLFVLANENALTHHPLQFIYYNMVVISTVGFGDFSPASDAGKAIVCFFQIPSGLIVFATFIGKVTQLFINIARSNMNGSNDFSHFDGHILILCWDEHSTEQIIKLILGDKKRKKRPILLCVTEAIEHPFPEMKDILFARLTNFSDQQELQRIGLGKAHRIIIDGKSDDETLSIALSIATNASTEANISAHFFNKDKAELLKMHCPQIECSIDNSAQMMVRCVQDPGASQVAELLLSTLHGATLYCLQLPKIKGTITFDTLFNKLKASHGMILIAHSHSKNGKGLQLNPSPDTPMQSHDYLHYIANERIAADEINWDALR